MSEARRVPDYLLERLAQGDLSAAEAARVRAALAAEPDGAARLAALAASNQEILAKLPPRVVAAEVRRRLAATAAARRRPLLSFVAPGVALGLAGLVAVLVGVRARDLPSLGGEGAAEVTREKGLRPQLAVFRKDAGDKGGDRLAAGATVRPGDVLQLSYVSAGRPYGVIVSVDARGTVTPHLPPTAGTAARLEPKGETLLPHAYELDATPGFERFVLVTSSSPFSTAVVTEWLRPGGPALPPDLSVVEINLRKEIP